MSNYIQVDYAFKNSLDCLICHDPIEYNSLIICEVFDDEPVKDSNWRHLDCMRISASNKNIQIKDVKGWNKLNSNDRRVTEQRINLLKNKIGKMLTKKQLEVLNSLLPLQQKRSKRQSKQRTQYSRTKSESSKSNKKNKYVEDREGVLTRAMRRNELIKLGMPIPEVKKTVSFSYLTQLPKRKPNKKKRRVQKRSTSRSVSKSKPRKKNGKKQQRSRSRSSSLVNKKSNSRRAKQVSKQKTKPQKKRSRSVKQQQYSASSSSSEQRYKIKNKKNKNKQKEDSKGPSKSQKKQYQYLLQSFLQLSNAELKQILELNQLSKSGNKQQMASRCAAGSMFGKILKCEHCGGGRPRFQLDKLQWKCPGYMDDESYKNCNKIYKYGQAKTEMWISKK